MKKNRGDEAIQIIIHIYLEMLQGNFPCYLKQAKAKMSFIWFSSTKLRKRKVEKVLWGGGGVNVGTSGRGGGSGEVGGEKVKEGEYCVHMYANVKNDTC
jgi:hypothetical protein